MADRKRAAKVPETQVPEVVDEPKPMAAITIEGFSGAEVFAWAQERLHDLSLPLPRRPVLDSNDTQYAFPEDPDAMTTTELGQFMLRLAGYAGYRMRQLGVLESELVALEREYRPKVAVAGMEVREQIGGRPSAETVESNVLASHPELMPLYKRVTEIETVRANLKRQVELFVFQWQALSREQARRSEQGRTGG